MSSSPSPLVAFSDAVADLVASAGPSVVRVEARGPRGASGVVWSADGVVVTAHHVVEREDHIHVTFADGRSLDAALVGRDPGTDVAVLKVEATGLAPPAWSGLDGVQVGHLALAVSRPGKSARAALGVVSALGEGFRTPAGGKLDRYLQTDVAPHHGFSGSLLVDARGRALGLNTAGLVRDAHVAVPTATLRRVVDELVAHGQIRRGFLGVGIYPVRLPAPLAKSTGRAHALALVNVEPGSPADRAGLLLGDVLLDVDGHALEHPGDLYSLLEDAAGKELAARVLRAGDVRDVKLTPGQRA